MISSCNVSNMHIGIREPATFKPKNIPCCSLLVKNVLTMPANCVAMGMNINSVWQTYSHAFIGKRSEEFIADNFSKVLWQVVNLRRKARRGNAFRFVSIREIRVKKLRAFANAAAARIPSGFEFIRRPRRLGRPCPAGFWGCPVPAGKATALPRRSRRSRSSPSGPGKSSG